MAGLLLIVAVIALAVYLTQRPEPAKPTDFAFGSVAGCRIVPPFARALGYTETSITDTQGNQKGLVIYNPGARAGDPPSNVYQHPTWDDAGYLGPLTADHNGNLYVAPTPRISVYDNPLDKANTIYRVDANTGALTEYLALPISRPPSAENPFGILGLAYDCDTHSLYVSSVSGSTRQQENGVIYRISIDTKQVVSQLPLTDAFGLAVFNGVSGKRLYFGSARLSEVRSVALSKSGDFAGVARQEFSMAGWGAAGDEKARRLVIDVNNLMTVRAMPFEFTLIASSERPQSVYQLRYDATSDTWQFLGNQ